MGRLNVLTSPQERLRSLGAAVTIGTDRVGSAQGAVDALLTDAARFGVSARAGWRPPTLSGRLAECPPDDRPLAPGPAAATLLRLLADPDAALIEEWAQLAVRRGVVVDAAAAPLVLDWWARQPRRSEAVFAALGRRGEWLASLNASWHKPIATGEVPADADDLWQLGKSAERLALLISVRRCEPARARALIESTWLNDGANDRQRFLEVLRENASMADEPFLESALDDRSKLVRRQAADVLAVVSGSRLRQRMSEAAKAIVSVRGPRSIPGRSLTRIVLQPPDSFVASWERDGLEERPPEGIGQRAWWMRQILARADLDVWTSLAGMTPEAILESLKSDDYFGDAVQALIAAANATSDARWSTALVRCLLDQRAIDLASVAALLEALPDREREVLSLEIIKRAPLTVVDRWALLGSLDEPWSASFSTEATEALSAEASPGVQDLARLSRAIENVSRRISPDALDGFEQAVTRSFSGTPPPGALFSIERARLRGYMHKEFTS